MRNKRKQVIALFLVALVALIGVLVHRVALAKETTTYRFATVERGSLQQSVSATGTIDAVTTVSVGTQVSGQVSEIFVDFNDRVKKGQLLARIDPTLALQAVADAQANVERAQAQALQASREHVRNRELSEYGLVARSAYEETQSGSSVAQASVKSARIALERAQQNLAYTNIYAPIDGVVVARGVEKGQTVAASLSAPELFKIAADLSEMQILAQVGESDIAQIQDGQPVEFTVQALPDQKFKGLVKQVRLESKTQDNVVNYTVVVNVDNAGGKLLPGMTARARFLTKSAENVLTVPNAALRFKPSDEQLAALRESRRNANASEGTAPATATSAGPQRQRGAAARTRPNSGTLFYLQPDGKLSMTRVRLGISDGTTTEISGKNITEGMKVIAGASSPNQQAGSSTSANPFQQNQGTQQRGPRGGF